MSEVKLSKIFYSPQGYWKGLAAIKKLAKVGKVSEKVALAWLKKQAIWQVYLLAPHRIPRPKYNVPTPNNVHKANFLFLPHNTRGWGRRRKTYKCALTVVDVANRYKEAEPLTTKEARDVADAFQRIYKCSLLQWPWLLQVDPGCEFMGAISKTTKENGVTIHHDQAILEHFNHTFAEPLFDQQYAVEVGLPP